MRPLLSDERIARFEQVLDARLCSLTVALENLHDPHNGAAAIRSIEAFGLSALHVVESVEPFRFSSSVTIGCERWVDVHRYPTFTGCADHMHADGYALYAAVPGAGESIDTIAVDRPCAIVFGNEHEGLTEAAIAACDRTVSIPMFGFTESFNLSVSVAVSIQRLAARRREVLGTDGDLEGQERARLRARWYAQRVRGAHEIVARYVSNQTQTGVGSVTQPDENH
jgi:tRNA (guanosine-2'-O-)-methyltransferase